MAETAPRTLITLATYNEKDNLPTLIQEIFAQAPDVNILVIDDNSPDGTGKLVDELGAKDPRIHALHRPGKLGLGTATMDGMRYAIANNYDFVLNMDADFSHHPRYIPALLNGMKENDVMIGSRYIPGGGTVEWGLVRKLMSWGINTYSRVLLGIKPRDCSGAFRCYRVAKLKEINFADVYSRGYSFQEEFLYHCRRVGCRMSETPIIFENRRQGTSKINKQEAAKALWCLFYVAVKRLTGQGSK